MIPERKQAIIKGLAVTFAAAVTAGCFLAVPWIGEALPASFGALLTLTPLQPPIQALRPEPAPHESLLWGESSEELSAEEESSAEESAPLPPPENAVTVSAGSYCWYEPGETPTLDLMNRTGYTVELESFLEQPFPIDTSGVKEDEPLVLIVHTHGTEAYLPHGVDYYLPEEDFRSEDPEETVVAVGNVIAKTLESLGIAVLHDTTMHDAESFNYAYTHSAAAVERYLEEYPSIRYVLDVHRDSIFDGDGVCGKTLTTIDGKDTAQVMLVVGTDESGASHPGWKKNLTVAACLEEGLNRFYPTLARPVNLREHGFNQWLSPGSLILEVGSCGNTVTEAKRAGEFFARAFAVLVKEKG